MIDRWFRKYSRWRFLVVAVWIILSAESANAQSCGELVGRWPYGPAKAVAVFDDHLFYSSGTVLRIAELSSPAHRMVGEVVLPGVIGAVAVTGGYAYVADGPSALRLVDVSDPTAPQQIGACAVSNWAARLAVTGSHAYVTDIFSDSRLSTLPIQPRPRQSTSFRCPATSRK